MPWIDKDECTECGMCVEECPVETIYMENEKAEINMTNCIRCGKCHDVCPVDAVRHDSEKIPDEVSANTLWAKNCMNACAEYSGDDEEKQQCLNRIIKYFNKEKKWLKKHWKSCNCLRTNRIPEHEQY